MKLTVNFTSDAQFIINKSEILRAILIRYRHEAGLTQREVSRKINISQPFYSLLESGVRKFDLIRLHSIAEAFNVCFSDVTLEFEHCIHECNNHNIIVESK